MDENTHSSSLKKMIITPRIRFVKSKIVPKIINQVFLTSKIKRETLFVFFCSFWNTEIDSIII